MIVAAALVAAGVLTGQSPDCERYCMWVRPHEAPEGSVITFKGHHWRPNRPVTATFGAYCRRGEACIDIAYFVRLKTGDRGGFTFRLRAGSAQAGDHKHGIHSGGRPTFSQRARNRTVRRSPRYRVLLPD